VTARARSIVVAIAGLALGHACGRRVELETEPRPVFDAGAGVVVDVVSEPIQPDGPVPVIGDAGLSLEAGDGCAARPTGCPSTEDFPCGKTLWLSEVLRTCRERAGCVAGFLTIRFEGAGCASEIGMTEVDRAFVDCLAGELQGERCPCTPALDTFYLGPDC
jgi:hypothetical protein